MTNPNIPLATTSSVTLVTPPPGADAKTGATAAPPKMSAQGLDFYYDKYHALKNVSLDIAERKVTALIGP